MPWKKTPKQIYADLYKIIFARHFRAKEGVAVPTLNFPKGNADKMEKI